MGMATKMKGTNPQQIDIETRKMQVERLISLEQTVPLSVPHSRVIVKSMQHLWKALNTPMSFDHPQKGQ